MLAISHLPQNCLLRGRDWATKPVRQREENRKATLTTCREPWSDQLIFPGKGCLYAGTDTYLIFGILAKFDPSEKAFKLELAV